MMRVAALAGLRRRAVRGLTLIELLLTLVIFSLVLGVFSQALFQVAQFERSFERNTMQWQKVWNTGFALEEVFDRLQLLPESRGAAVKGSELLFEATGVSNVAGQEGQAVRWVMLLKPSPAESTDPLAPPAWGLWLKLQPLQELAGAGLLGTTEREVARWPSPVRFEYVNFAGAGYANWPPLNAGLSGSAAASNALDAQWLPSAVRVVSQQGRLMYVWAVRAPAQRRALQRSTAAPTAGSEGLLNAYAN